MARTYCYPYKRGTGWRSQGFRSGKGSPYNAPGGHTGFDQAMPAGTPIYAPGDGIIRNSSWLRGNYLANPWWLTAMGGDTLVLDCTDAFGNSDNEPTFIIAHLQESTAEVGQRVRKGQQIGISGNSGTATTGAHAHIEALPPRWDVTNGVYGRVDPERYFTEWPEDIHQGLAAAGETTSSTPTPTPKEESEMPVSKLVNSTFQARHRLPKGQPYTLSVEDDGTRANFAINQVGHYLIHCHVRGQGLLPGQTIKARFIVTKGGKASGHHEQDIVGTLDGTFSQPLVFNRTVDAGTVLSVELTSVNTETAYCTGFGAEVTTWKEAK